MYKSKLQEVCQQKGWVLPKYETIKLGLHHHPQFRATVIVNSSSFHSESLANSSKEAQNDAARLAFFHFSPPPSPVEPAAASAPARNELPPTTRHPPHEAAFSMQQPYQPRAAAKSEPSQVAANLAGSSTLRNEQKPAPPAGVPFPVQQPSQPVATAKSEPLQVAANLGGSSTLRNEQKLATYNPPAGIPFPSQQPSQPVATAKIEPFPVAANLGGSSTLRNEQNLAMYNAPAGVPVQQPSQPVTTAKIEPFQVAANLAGSSTLRNEQKLATHNAPAGVPFPVQQPSQPVTTAKIEPFPVAANLGGSSTLRNEQKPATNNVPAGVPFPVQQPSQPAATAKIEPFPVAANLGGSSTLRNEQKLAAYNVPSGVPFSVQQPSQPVASAKIDDHFQGVVTEAHHLCKNQLQTYAQKRNLPLPVYSSECQGPPHARRFKGKVTVDGKTFEAQELFTTLNKAELAAAKIALMSLLPDGTEQDDLSYKNLLQELAQRKGYRLPVYTTNVSGEAHFPNFASSVEIGGDVFKGQEARTKKQAEMSAAKVAYIALNPSNSSKSFCSTSAPSVQDAPQLSSTSLRADVTAYLLENVQPKLPVFSEGLEHRGLESNSASGAMPTLTNLAINSAIEHLIGMSSLCQNRIIVHPRKEEVTYPPGSRVLPVSDDDWVAVKVTPSINQ